MLASHKGEAGIVTKKVMINGMLQLRFVKDNTHEPNNLDAVALQWDLHMCTERGRAGDFIGNGAYYLYPKPETPDLEDLAEDSLQYEVEKTVYLDSVKAVEKENRKMVYVRPQMYAAMKAATSEEAWAQVMRSPNFSILEKTKDDPLGLWNVMKISLVVVQKGNTAFQKVTAREAFNSFKQMPGVALEEYLRIFKS